MVAGPRVGVGGVLVHDGGVLLIRRGKPPYRGRWTIPGGTVELGESLSEALVREMREETGLEVEPLELALVFDRIMRQGERVEWHYVIVDYFCRWVSGELQAGSDAEAARFVAAKDLEEYDLLPDARSLVERAFERSDPPRP